MDILQKIITALAVCVFVASRPLASNEVILKARDATLGNAAVSNWTDTQSLQLAVTMENLEIYYVGAILDGFSQSDFASAGYAPWVRNRLLQLQEHDQAHYEYLAALLHASNASVPLPCEYPIAEYAVTLGVEDSLIGLCAVEQFVQSAYLGLQPYTKKGSGDTGLAQLASSEARHQGWTLASVLREEPWSGPWDTSLTPDQTNAFLPDFIGSCPSSNPEFPQVIWPTLYIAGPLPTTEYTTEYDGPPGLPAQLNYSGILDKQAGETWLNVQSGLGIRVIPIGDNGTFTVPTDFQGFSYGMVVATNETEYTLDQIIAGPLAFHNGFNSSVPNPGLEPTLPH